MTNISTTPDSESREENINSTDNSIFYNAIEENVPFVFRNLLMHYDV